MEISTAASPKSPETLPTPTARIHPNGGPLKRHLSPPPPPAYKECLRNHAASRGGLSLDGCCEFMPDPASPLNCAACSCHRNFHRRISSPPPSPDPPLYLPQHRHRLPPPPTPNSPSPPPISSSYYHSSAPHMLISLAGGNSAPPHHHHHHHQANSAPAPRKRFRTKFSQVQKERMLGFAAKIGWKMQRCNDDLVAQFCSEIGVERGVFKVWMHNNKNHYVKRDLNVDFGSNGNGVGANGSSSTS